MNILFLTLYKIRSIEQNDLYTDLMNEFVTRGHNVHIISPIEKKEEIEDFHFQRGNVNILGVKIGNYFNVRSIEKGLTLISLERKYLRAIKKNWGDVHFDLILYSTPPITFNKVLQYFKNKGALTYLLLKDIFPQNAVDLGMINRKGIYGLAYKRFRKQEERLYQLSDVIGCMSQANIDYILKNNPTLLPSKLEVSPNAISIREPQLVNRENLRNYYKLPLDKKIFIYGGNLGKPQGPEFILQCLEANEKNKNSYILIIGDGSEYPVFKKWFEKMRPENAKLIRKLPKDEYLKIVGASDVGLIFLDYRFSIPNFPSRLLSYMEMSMPVLAATDVNTDIGKTIEENNFGYWCESADINKFNELLNKLAVADLKIMGENSYRYLKENYTVEIVCDKILGHLEK